MYKECAYIKLRHLQLAVTLNGQKESSTPRVYNWTLRYK